MAYKDKLCKFIDAMPGGRSLENLSRIATATREVQDDFNLARLSQLMIGGAAFRPEDIQALAIVFGVPPRQFLDDSKAIKKGNRDRIYKFAEERMKRPDLTYAFYRYVTSHTKFRKKVDTELIDYDLLYSLSSDFLDEIAEEESLDT